MGNELPFASMSEKIIHNMESKFGGAAVLVPPNGGPPISILTLDDTADEGQFWATVLTRIQQELENIRQKQKGLYGVR